MSGNLRVLDPFARTEGSTSHTALPADIPSGVKDTAELLAPALLDLVAFPQEPGFEHRETLLGLAHAARRGGVGVVGLMPNVRPVADHDGVVRTLRDGARPAETGVRFIVHGALSVDLRHESIAPMGELKEAGVRMVTDGGIPVHNSRFLRRALEYAANFDLPVLLTPVDPDLAEGGLAPEGKEATRLGLPAVPDTAERLAVFRAGELARLTGAKVIVFPLVTAAGLEALADVRRRGAPIFGGTALPYLLWTVDDLETFDGLYRLDPPLPRSFDGIALAQAVREGLLDFVATGHRAVNLSEKQTELPQAEPGMAVLSQTWSALARIERRHDIPLLDLVAAMTAGPAGLLGIEPWPASVVVGPGAAAGASEPPGPVELAANLPPAREGEPTLRTWWPRQPASGGILAEGA
jgi:dihydroorotase